MIKLLKKEWRFGFAFLVIGIVSRIFFLEKFQSHWDGPDYSLAILHYSFIEKTPTQPGYPLYIALGKLFHLFIGDLHLSILGVSILFAGIGVFVCFVVGRILFGRAVGVISSLLFLTAPTVYYFGITANPYGLIPTTTSLFAIVVYLIVIHKKQYGILLGFIAAFAIGIRPQDTIFLLPLGIYGFYYLKSVNKISAISSFILFFGAWFIPTVIAVGGLNEYFKYIFNFAKNDTLQVLSLSHTAATMPIILKGFYQTFTLSSIFLLYFLKPVGDLFKSKKDRRKVNIRLFIFFLLWIVPSLMFNLFIRSDHAAHQMAYLSAFIYLVSYSLWIVLKKEKLLLIFILAFLLYFNLFTFFRDRDPKMMQPYVSQSYHFSELIKNDIRTPSIVDLIKKYPVNSTMIIVDPEIFRPITYHLKHYRVYAFSSLDTSEPSMVNTVHYGYEWHYKSFESQRRQLIIPNKITNLIIIPNNKKYELKGIKYKQIMVTGNAFLYIIETSPSAIYELSIHSLIRN